MVVRPLFLHANAVLLFLRLHNMLLCFGRLKFLRRYISLHRSHFDVIIGSLITGSFSRFYGNAYSPTTYHDYKKEVQYSLSEILDGKASPIKAAKDVYSKRLEAVKESLKHKDKMTDEQLKQIKGKSAEEVLELMYPKEIPDYQKLKASRYYEEHRETLQKVDTGIKILAWVGAVGGVVLSPFTGGSSLALTYASTAYLATDSAYSAVTGHTMITGDRLSTEERVWAGIDAASVVLSAGAGSYLTKLRKAGKAGSTLLKLASHADDVNDVSKVAYAMATGKDTKAAIGNLVMGQVQGAAVNKAGGLLHGKFGKANAPDVPDIPTNSTKQHIEVDSSGLNSKKLKIDPTVVHQKKTPKLDLKIEPTVKADLASTPKPHVDVETSKIKPVEAVAGAATTVPKSKTPDIDVLTKPKDLSTIKGESVDQVGTVKPKVDLDVPEVSEVHQDKKTSTLDRNIDDNYSDQQSRIKYLHSKYGQISSEELHQRINLRGETMKQYNAMKEVVKSKRQLGPAFATVYDKTTGKYYSAINNFDGKKPGDLHPLLQERYNNASQDLIDSYVKTKGFASHAEVYAVNEALKANPNATMDDLLVNVIHADKGKSYINKMPYAGGEMFVRCRHCQYMLDGFNMISEVGK